MYIVGHTFACSLQLFRSNNIKIIAVFKRFYVEHFSYDMLCCNYCLFWNVYMFRISLYRLERMLHPLNTRQIKFPVSNLYILWHQHIYNVSHMSESSVYILCFMRKAMKHETQNNLYI